MMGIFQLPNILKLKQKLKDHQYNLIHIEHSTLLKSKI